MAWNPTDEDVKRRIDEIEATLNGLMIYLAAVDMHLPLDLTKPKLREFIRENLARPSNARLQQAGAIAGDGALDFGAMKRVQALREKLKEYSHQ